jgi:hypothetical protein
MLADGTDGELITWDTAGVADTVAVGTVGDVLTSGGTGVAPTFQAPAGGAGSGTSSFLVTGTAISSTTTAGTLLAKFNTEDFDTGGDFNLSTDIFTAPQDGIYLFTGAVRITLDAGAATATTRVHLQLTNTGVNMAMGGEHIDNVLTNIHWASGSAIVSLSTGNTAQLDVVVTGGGIPQWSIRPETLAHFSGTLLA